MLRSVWTLRGQCRRMLAAIERGVDWNRFLALANRNSVDANGRRAGSEPEGIAKLPPHVARALRLGYQVNALRCNHRAGCALEIVDSFAAKRRVGHCNQGPSSRNCRVP